MRKFLYYFNRAAHGTKKCGRCGHKFKPNEPKFIPYPIPPVAFSICGKCKARETLEQER